MQFTLHTVTPIIGPNVQNKVIRDFQQQKLDSWMHELEQLQGQLLVVELANLSSKWVYSYPPDSMAPLNTRLPLDWPGLLTGFGGHKK